MDCSNNKKKISNWKANKSADLEIPSKNKTKLVQQPDANAESVNKINLSNNSKFSIRLPSILPPRDLTLGGRGRTVTKKVFVPNLNVVRNKNLTVKTCKDAIVTTHNNAHGRQRESAGRGAYNSRILQTMGIFSEGMNSGVVRKTSHSTNKDNSSSLHRSTMQNRSSRKERINAVHNLLDILAGDDIEGECITDVGILPVYVKPNEVESIEEFKSLNIHREIDDGPATVEDLLTSKKTHMFLMELPENLPYLEELLIPKETITKTYEWSHLLKSKSTLKKPHVTAAVDEGKIGRLVRFKSGQIKLLLGDNHMNVTMISERNRYQDVMSISANIAERNAKLINLGPLNTVMKVAPDWEFLLEGQGTNL